ncbi:MAG: NADH-ubiquinone oxidoreductase-F iron-sulfur binding region domain-containing protein [Ketobacteraceae bacterium]|nr:NADH-ubiquinone oxidoreductase-F iron-sulfur binding region domain-containing protein [Ketobacteraceae bacterium]
MTSTDKASNTGKTPVIEKAPIVSPPLIRVALQSHLPYDSWPEAAHIVPLLQDIEARYFQGNLQRKDLLQLLIRLQQQFGWIHGEAINWCVARLAGAETISHAEIHGIIDFYSFLERRPCPPYHLYLSTNVTDSFSGQADNLAFFQKLQQRHPARFRVTTSSCTGLCDQGPAGLLNGYPVPAIDPGMRQTIQRLIEGDINVNEFRTHCRTPVSRIRQTADLLQCSLKPGVAIARVLQKSPLAFLEELTQSQLRGRGGAGFSTAIKWAGCRQAASKDKVIVCNADEGEPGTFKDRVLLQDHLEQVIEGMTIAAYTVGARHGFIYLRYEYQYLLPHLEAVIKARYQQGLLGESIGQKAGFDFNLGVQLGAGAYICGEESALIESMEGKRGIPRIRPPFPAEKGYLGLPTIVNNVETFCCVTDIALRGASAFASQSCENSTGTKIHSISGDCARPGIYELPFDATINEALSLCGASRTQAVQVGGPSGKLLFSRHFHLALNFSQVSTGGSFMVFDETRDLFDIVKNFTDFFHHESCGFCTPCRVGCGILSKKLDKFARAHASAGDIVQLEEMMELMDVASHCGLGQTAAHPVRYLLQEKPDFFSRRALSDKLLKIDIAEHTSQARRIMAAGQPSQQRANIRETHIDEE